MRLSRLEQANNYEVQNWITEKLNLTPYQRNKIIEEEIIRFAPFEFYKQRKQEKVSILWRITLLIFPFYLLVLILINPIKWIITGKWGYGRKFIDNFHHKWVNKLNL